jgi:FkbM family methyltransferase
MKDERRSLKSYLPSSLRRWLRDLLAYPVRWYVRYFPGSVGKRWLVSTFLDRALLRQHRAFVARAKAGGSFACRTDDLIGRHIYEFGVWEPNLTHWVSRCLAARDVFVDVGANIGYFSVLASRLVGPMGQVVAIEASPSIFRALEANLVRNGSKNARSVNLAASDRDGRLVIFAGPDWNRAQSTTVPTVGLEPESEVAARPLAEILTRNELSRARLVKIDVEGAELAVLRGLAPALEAMRPDVELMVEVSPRALAGQGESADELVSLLREHGFNVYRLENDYDPSSYVDPPKPPVRWDRALVDQADLVFSRVDAAFL